MGIRIIRGFKEFRWGRNREGGSLREQAGVNREMRDACIHCLGAAYTSHKTYL